MERGSCRNQKTTSESEQIMPLSVETHVALGLDQRAPNEVNGRSNMDIMASLEHPGDAPYHPCPEAHADDVPEGNVTRHAQWQDSEIYPATHRNLSVYTPANFDHSRPARLIVFQDGNGYLSRNGAVQASRVLDTLHARAEIEQTVGVFVDPGVPEGVIVEPGEFNVKAMQQRSYEYDSLTPDYGNFLLDEVLPYVAGAHSINFTSDPAERTICGISSGGICAFTAAWMHPGHFQRVLSHCGSYVAIRGGQNYPYLIRTTERKPIRVFLQSGENDAQTLAGDWPLANRTMANALAYAGYDHQFVFGSGGHSLRHGGAIFADSLRWLWSVCE
jgi:enterochelin esterase family protein